MTIEIAALCNNKKSIVFVADRMLTFGEDFFKTESLQTKYHIFHKRLIIGTAGSATRPIELLEDLSNYSETLFQDFFKICEKFKEIYKVKRTQAVEETILQLYGLSLEEFKATQENFSMEFTKNLWEEISEFDYEVDVLLAGLGKKQAHLAVVSNPGVCQFFDDIGFVAIGNGDNFAIVSLANEQYDVKFPIHRALISVYFAKKMAEKVPGVGSETDISILHEGRVIQLPCESKKLLEELYLEYQEIQTHTLAKFAKEKKEKLKV